MTDQSGHLLYQYNEIGRNPKYQYFDFNGKIDYQHLTHRKGEALTFSYLLSTTNQENSSSVSYEDKINFPLSYDSLSNHSIFFDRIQTFPLKIGVIAKLSSFTGIFWDTGK